LHIHTGNTVLIKFFLSYNVILKYITGGLYLHGDVVRKQNMKGFEYFFSLLLGQMSNANYEENALVCIDSPLTKYIHRTQQFLFDYSKSHISFQLLTIISSYIIYYSLFTCKIYDFIFDFIFFTSTGVEQRLSCTCIQPT